MSVEKVRAYLTPYGVAQRIRELEVSSATVELAAAALGVAPARIAKTLSFKVGERPILVVAAGDARINNSKYKHFFGVKARMLTPEEAVEHIGHAVGGRMPLRPAGGRVRVSGRVSAAVRDGVPRCGQRRLRH